MLLRPRLLELRALRPLERLPPYALRERELEARERDWLL